MTVKVRFFAIYDHPTEYPESWVLREVLVGPGTVEFGTLQVANSLAEARINLPPGATLLEGEDSIDPNSEEVWVAAPE